MFDESSALNQVESSRYQNELETGLSPHFQNKNQGSINGSSRDSRVFVMARLNSGIFRIFANIS